MDLYIKELSNHKERINRKALQITCKFNEQTNNKKKLLNPDLKQTFENRITHPEEHFKKAYRLALKIRLDKKIH